MVGDRSVSLQVTDAGGRGEGKIGEGIAQACSQEAGGREEPRWHERRPFLRQRAASYWQTTPVVALQPLRWMKWQSGLPA